MTGHTVTKSTVTLSGGATSDTKDMSNSRIIPAETREFLSKSGPSIMEAMLEAISGTSVNQPVTKLMLRADQESVSRDLRQSRLDVDEFSYGVPVERYVFDAIRRLV